MGGLKTVFFDLGDTITDLGEGRGEYEARVLVRAARIHALLHTHGAQPRAESEFCPALANSTEGQYQAALSEQRGLTLAEALRRFFVQEGLVVPDELLEQCVESYCRGSGQPAPLRLGAMETLRTLKESGLRLGVISNTIQPAHYMDASLADRGLLPFFEVRVYSSELGRAKPHSAIFEAALQALSLSPAEAVHVGDRPEADVAGAHSAGMRAVLIRVPGRAADAHADRAPDATIDELPELPAVLERWRDLPVAGGTRPIPTPV
jgi:HAD superfamily hydrolase (TIGR01509 family)